MRVWKWYIRVVHNSRGGNFIFGEGFHIVNDINLLFNEEHIFTNIIAMAVNLEKLNQVARANKIS